MARLVAQSVRSAAYTTCGVTTALSRSHATASLTAATAAALSLSHATTFPTTAH